MGILNQWLIAIFDENSNFSHWSLWSDSVWTYILGAIFWKTVRKRVTIWFSELHLFFMFSLWILDVYLKILILTHFSPVKYFGKSKPTILGAVEIFHINFKLKKKYLNEWQNCYASSIPCPVTQILSLNTQSFNLVIFGPHNVLL